jgi:phosphosulfolactate synthase (CoM biosynthesis protein A)
MNQKEQKQMKAEIVELSSRIKTASKEIKKELMTNVNKKFLKAKSEIVVRDGGAGDRNAAEIAEAQMKVIHEESKKIVQKYNL